MEERKSESFQKSINEEKYEISEPEHAEILVTDNPVVKEPSCFNLLEYDENILNRLEVMYKRACMATSRDKYYTEMFRTLTYYNYRNNAPLLNENILKEIYKVTDEESILDSNNVTVDTFRHPSNTHRYNENQYL